MTILSKSCVGLSKKAQDWADRISLLGDSHATSEYDEQDGYITLDCHGAARVVIKEMPPAPISRILNAGEVTFFQLDINRENIHKLFSPPPNNLSSCSVVCSNCTFDTNRYGQFCFNKFISCAFRRFLIRNSEELEMFRLDRCEIENLYLDFAITPSIAESFHRFKSNNNINNRIMAGSVEVSIKDW